MKKLEETSDFPVQPKPDKIREDLAEKGSRTADDLDEKDLRLLRRIYEFTPNSILENRFGLSTHELRKAKEKLEAQGYEMQKSTSYNKSVVKADPNRLPGTSEEARDHFLHSYIGRVATEEERREIMLLYEQGLDPVNMLEQLITIQYMRTVKGGVKEGGDLDKNVNEASRDLGVMITKLHEMKEGIKQVHGFDDSFTGLLLAMQKRGQNK